LVFVQGRALGTVTVTAQATGYNNGTGTMVVDPSGFTIATGNFTTTAAAANTPIQVRAQRLDATTLNAAEQQAVRGGLSVAVSLSSSNANVGTVPAAATFGPNVSSSSTAAFDPVAQGTTTVSVITPTGFATPSNQQQIVVTVNP